MNYISRYKMVKEIYFYFKAPIKKRTEFFNRIRTIILFLNHWLCIVMPSDIRFRGMHGFVSIIVELFLAVLNTLLQWNACYNEKICTLCIVKGFARCLRFNENVLHSSLFSIPFLFYFLLAINILLTSLHFCENI